MDEALAAVICVFIVAIVALVIIIRWQNERKAERMAEAEARKWEAMTKLTDNVPDMTPPQKQIPEQTTWKPPVRPGSDHNWWSHDPILDSFLKEKVEKQKKRPTDVWDD